MIILLLPVPKDAVTRWLLATYALLCASIGFVVALVLP